MVTISSQRYLDPATVAAKREAGDYVVSYVLVTVGGVEYRVVVDGHHSLAAARKDGVEPAWTPAHQECQSEADAMGGEPYLTAHMGDCDWYDVATGEGVW